MEMSGLATTWTIVMPEASTNSAPRNNANEPAEEAGTNRRQPTIMVSNPMVAVRI